MKKKESILAFLVLLILLPFSSLKAQYGIPSFSVELTEVNTTFEEDVSGNPFIRILSMEERQMVVDVEDENPNQTTWAIVYVYSIDGLDELGPYTVYEGTPLQVPVDDREWGVRVCDFLEGCELSAWIQ